MREIAGATGLAALVLVAVAAAVAPVLAGSAAAALLPSPGLRGTTVLTASGLTLLAAVLALPVGWLTGLAAKVLAVLIGVHRRSHLRAVDAALGLVALTVLLQALVFAAWTAAGFAALVATALAMAVEPWADRALTSSPTRDHVEET